MKTLHLIDSLRSGGAENLLKTIFEKEVSNSELFLFCLRKSATMIEILHPNIYISKSEKRYSLKTFFEIKKLIKEKNIEVLHCHLTKSKVIGLLLKIFFRSSLKIIFHEHGEIMVNENKNWNHLYRFILRFFQNKINCFLSTSDISSKHLIEKCKIPEEKIIYLPNVVNLEKFNRENLKIDVLWEKLRLRIPPYVFVIGFIGRLEKIKGCEYLIRSIPYLQMDYRMLVVGTGSLQDELENIVHSFHVEEQVLFLGYRSDIPNILALCDVVVVPSENESFPIITVESRAMGVPVVAANVQGLNEVLRDGQTSLLFEAKNPKDLAEKLNKLYFHEELQTYLSANGKLSVQKYDVASYVENLQKITDSL